jgi:hypothetical protein
MTISKSLRRFARRVARRKFEYRYDHLEDRAGLADRVRGLTRNGQIGIIYGGMDCDCSTFSRSTVLPAVPRLVERFIDRFHDGAEGPQWTRIVTPIEACAHVASSRDLALEAFEDGHPHAVVMAW